PMRIGIDLGGTKVEGIILDQQQVLHRLREATPPGDYAATVDLVVSMINQLQSQSGSRLPVGIGTPGAISAVTRRMKNCNSTCLNERPLKEDIEKQLGYEVRLANDADCFVLSEAELGAARAFGTVFGVILGTGVGGGLVINRTLLNGPNGISGEWGHNALPVSALKLIDKERQCYCGRSNCIETVLSGPGLSRSHKERHGQELDARGIAEAASAGDAASLDSIEHYSEMLAACLATVINLVDPQAIVLGGGLSNISNFYTELPRRLPAYVFSDSLETKILPPSHGDASGALGAACLWPLPKQR
ncbi:MAG: ROK family protein, partial [Pseudomonadales bacterium]|nr:ROK family protein [Pseudomonadales bacterium]